MNPCTCTERHDARRIVLTGGPGAGKTAVLELIRLFFCVHVRTLPESAGIVFGGGFPRNERPEVRRASQRAIFHVQRELEATETPERAAVVLCDRGTLDGAAYWPGPDDLFSAVGTTREQELSRYHAVIHLRTPTVAAAYGRENPLRVETIEEAAVIDQRIAAVWAGHPRWYEVKETPDFLSKAAAALKRLRDEIPACCRRSIRPFLWGDVA
jgi:predicted ATPase